jgi:hypothetical protein
MSVTDPADAAADDVRFALHLPGATRGWSPRSTVRLPASTQDRVEWLVSYADWLRQEAEAAGRQSPQQRQAEQVHGVYGQTLEDRLPPGSGPPP